MKVTSKRFAGVAGIAAASALVLSACSGGGEIGGDTDGDSESGDAGGGTAAEGCEDFEQYGSFPGTTVSLFSSIRDSEADDLQATFDKFTECTGITVQHNGVGEFEQQLVVQVEGNNAPDLAIIPQPGLLKRMVATGKVQPADEATTAKVDEGWSPEWKTYGTVDDTFYAAPMLASVKSFVWYSPSAFEEHGYEVPKTLDEMMALTEKIAADTAGDGATKPWCAGIESGGATGWPATDWIEDFVLRVAGPDAYDQWVTNEIPFNAPEILESTNAVGDYLLNDAFVNGGIGDSRSIATTSFNDGGLPILDNQCYMYRMASFYEAQWPEGTTVAPDGDVFAFYLPAETADEAPLLVAGEFVARFADTPEAAAVQDFMASGTFANTRVELGGVTSANKFVDPALASSDILRLAIELLQDPNSVARFDGSDMMPSEVGAGSFWTGTTQWIDGQIDAETMLTNIQDSWPKG